MTEGLKTRKRGNVKSKDLNIFEWNIANFSQAFKNAKDGEKMISPVFVGKCIGLPNSFWRTNVWPKEKEFYISEKHLDVCLELVEELNQQNPVVKASYVIFLVDRNHQEVSFSKDEIGKATEAEIPFGGFFNFLGSTVATHSQLLDATNKCLEDDVLRVQVKVCIRNEEGNADASKIQNIDKLREDLSQLLASSQYSDVTIEVENLNLKSHKSSLSCRSPVFSAMFHNKMSESLTNIVKIEDFSSKTVKGMLEYIYSGNVEIVEEDFMELLKIADKYQLEELKLACTKEAILKISVENAMELMIIGDMYNAPELKSRAMDFISSSKANPMFSPGNKNGAFEKLAEKHSMLLVEMYQNTK